MFLKAKQLGKNESILILHKKFMLWKKINKFWWEWVWKRYSKFSQTNLTWTSVNFEGTNVENSKRINLILKGCNLNDQYFD